MAAGGASNVKSLFSGVPPVPMAVSRLPTARSAALRIGVNGPTAVEGSCARRVAIGPSKLVSPANAIVIGGGGGVVGGVVAVVDVVVDGSVGAALGELAWSRTWVLQAATTQTASTMDPRRRTAGAYEIQVRRPEPRWLHSPHCCRANVVSRAPGPNRSDARETNMADLPLAQGLYDPAYEHDACGVGFVVDMHGRA